jgi:two-component system OmpR family response regulator
MNKTLLVVDDDPELSELLRGYLGQHGYDVLLACDGAGMWKQIDAGSIDLVILDLMLPGEDGLTLCRNLRARSNIPILMLTARGDEVDRIAGLEMGADDYLSKPFSPRELVARIKALLRRTQDNEALGARTQRLRFAGWTIDLAAHHLVRPDGVLIALPASEFKLLKALAENPYRVLSRDALNQVLTGSGAAPVDRAVDMTISRLRSRLAEDARDAELIKTVRGEGYMLAIQVEHMT